MDSGPIVDREDSIGPEEGRVPGAGEAAGRSAKRLDVYAFEAATAVGDGREANGGPLNCHGSAALASTTPTPPDETEPQLRRIRGLAGSRRAAGAAWRLSSCTCTCRADAGPPPRNLALRQAPSARAGQAQHRPRARGGGGHVAVRHAVPSGVRGRPRRVPCGRRPPSAVRARRRSLCLRRAARLPSSRVAHGLSSADGGSLGAAARRARRRPRRGTLLPAAGPALGAAEHFSGAAAELVGDLVAFNRAKPVPTRPRRGGRRRGFVLCEWTLPQRQVQLLPMRAIAVRCWHGRALRRCLWGSAVLCTHDAGVAVQAKTSQLHSTSGEGINLDDSSGSALLKSSGEAQDLDSATAFPRLRGRRIRLVPRRMP